MTNEELRLLREIAQNTRPEPPKPPVEIHPALLIIGLIILVPVWVLAMWAMLLNN